MKLSEPRTSWFSKYVTVDADGKYRVDLKFFKRRLYEDPYYWKVQYEDVLNGPELYSCNRCGILDTKENLDRGVEHARQQCEVASYRRRVYDAVSLKCKLFPWLFEDELNQVKKSIKFQDNELYSYDKVLRFESLTFLNTFDIPQYESKDNVVPEDKWWFNSKYF